MSKGSIRQRLGLVRLGQAAQDGGASAPGASGPPARRAALPDWFQASLPGKSSREAADTALPVVPTQGPGSTQSVLAEAGVAALSPARRAQDLQRMKTETFDVAIVGGGVTGAAIALEAAARGLKVALLEANDLAAGTSSRSTKIIHAGLRYLRQIQKGALDALSSMGPRAKGEERKRREIFRDGVSDAVQAVQLIAEGKREQAVELHRAPHLSQGLAFTLPLERRWERAYVEPGVRFYDAVGGRRALPKPEHLGRAEAQAALPALDPQKVQGAIRYYDGQVDDARLTLTIARTAARHGAALATGTRVEDFLEEDGRIVGVKAQDEETGEPFTVRARNVVSATGVWTDELSALAGTEGKFRVKASKGIHVTVPKDWIPGESAIVQETEKSVLFIIPWGDRWMIGTTDTPWEQDNLSAPAATQADIDYVFAQANALLERPLSYDPDQVAVFSGLRPLVAGRTEKTEELSREHAIAEPKPGFFTIAGGKLTTNRLMAEHLVDAVAKSAGLDLPPSPTRTLPLVGTVGFAERWAQRETLAGELGLSVEQTERLLQRHGAEVERFRQLFAENPEWRLPLPGAESYLQAEVVQAVRAEGARSLDDVLARRTRAYFETSHRGVDSAPATAALMAKELGWSPARQASEVQDYRRFIAAERAAQRQLDDTAANDTFRSTNTIT